MRFLLSISILWLSSVTVHGVSLFSITPGNPSLNSQIAQNFFEVLLSKGTPHTLSPQQSPQGSPNASPSPSPSTNRTPPRPRHHHFPVPPYFPSISQIGPPKAVKSNGLNSGQRTGLVLLAVAGLLQIVVVSYLVVKRKQMLQVVEKYEV
ncbi:hypothetical protein SUGI_0581980 [Cryptomeria japonica]|nr:hypothetical protein SUGI_0581980 [Cryptomeria japonica]